MDLYILNIIFVIIYGSLIDIFNIPKKRNVFIFISFVHLLLIHSLRDPFIYPDTETYWFVFTQIGDNKTITDLLKDSYLLFRFEPGYIIFNYLISCISKSDYAIFFASSIVIVSGYLYPVYKYSKCPLLSVLIILLYPLIFQQSFFVLRQHMACAILMFGLPFIEKRNFLGFLLIQLIAISFHYSAVVLLPLYYVYNMNWVRINARIMYLFLLTFLFLRIGISYVASTNSRYEGYMEGAGNFLVFGLFLIITILYIKYVGYKANFMSESKDRIIIVFNFYALFVCFSLLGLSIGRLTNYFTYFLCIIIPFMYKALPIYLARCVVFVFILFIIYLNSVMIDFSYKFL